MATKKVLEFPKNVLLGTGSSAYQIEGGWEKDGKSPSVWDDLFHNHNFPIIPNNPWAAPTNAMASPLKKKKKHVIIHRGMDIHDIDVTSVVYFASPPKDQYLNGDIACDSIHKIDEDINNLKELGVDVYRFSICWPRVLPDGDDRTPNQAGIDYYKNLIKKLEDNNIKPLVTLFHWDLPQCLMDIGGLANPNIVSYFENYAAFIFRTFGDKVKLWSTFNEPRMIAEGYCYGKEYGVAPAIGELFNGIGNYMATRTMLLAHAAIYKLYQNSFKAQQGGEVSINFDITWFYPNDPNSEADCKAADRAFAFMVKMFIQPLITGEFPKEVIDGIEESNKRENITLKRFVDFTEEEKKSVKGSYDFLGFNYYFASKARASTKEEFEDMDLKTRDVNFVYGLNKDIDDACKGLERVIKWFEEECNNPTLFLMENGVSESYGKDQSQKKVDYFYGMLAEIHKAIERGIKIKGYCTWSFMDSMEWSSGYFHNLYGIYSVDFNDPERKRSKKSSYSFFEKLFKQRKLEHITVQQ